MGSIELPTVSQEPLDQSFVMRPVCLIRRSTTEMLGLMASSVTAEDGRRIRGLATADQWGTSCAAGVGRSVLVSGVDAAELVLHWRGALVGCSKARTARRIRPWRAYLWKSSATYEVRSHHVPGNLLEHDVDHRFC